MKYDVAVIGGGPGGYTAAEKAAKKGLSVVLFEKSYLGGTCLNRGCIPTKALLHEVSEERPWAEIQQKKEEVVATLRKGVEGLMKSCKVQVVLGEAHIEAPGRINCQGETYEAENIIVAVGAVPSLPPIPGKDSDGVYTSDHILEGDGKELKSIVIIGGGVIGVEIASFYAERKAEVLVLEIADHILPPMPKDVAQRAAVNLKKKGVEVQAQVKIGEILGTCGDMTVKYEDKKGTPLEAKGEAVLMATGRRAYLDGLFSEDMIEIVDPASLEGKTAEEVEAFALEPGKVKILKGAILGDKAGRTGIPGLYVIGDAKARNIQLAHVASAQAINAVSAIAGEPMLVDMDTVPSCIYTDPEIATVGLSEEEAKERGIEVKTSKVTTGSNGKCLIEGAESGFVKLVMDEKGVIIGAQLVCPRATDLIAELALAVSKKMTAEDIARVVHPHPTFSEMILSAAEGAL